MSDNQNQRQEAGEEVLDRDLELTDEDVLAQEIFEQMMAAPDFEETPILLVDTDPERAVRRQKEMMDTVFGGIGEETKAEKRMGLAMQQLDIEQRHALRLLLLYQDAGELTAHLQRCLDDPAYGYGERGDNGRTVAQAMMAVVAMDAVARLDEEDGQGDLGQIVAAWLDAHRDFQQAVWQGVAFTFRSLFDYADIDTFVPVVQRVGAASRAKGQGETTWRLGLEGEGKHRDFEGPLAETWPRLCDTYVQWSDEDNEQWLAEIKRKADRLPDTILRAAQADRLRKETDRVEVNGNRVTLITERDGEAWPRMLTLGDQIGLSRLSGHNFYELAWEGGLHVRRFEISSTSRNRIPFEHIELALRMAEALGAERGLRPEPVTAEQVEAAYLRRMKADGAELGPPVLKAAPPAIEGQPAAGYEVGDIRATMLYGGVDFAYVANGAAADQGVLLRRDEKRGVMMALPVSRGRPQRGAPLMTTPLADLDAAADPGWNRALCAWGAWLAQVSQ
jgi:hypothetical protein